MDVNHYFSGDINLSGTGDLSMVEGLTESQQRVIRRVLTNPGDYESHPDYGIGAGKYVGADVGQLSQLNALISDQITQELSVSPIPPPEVTTVSDGTILYINIKYLDVPTQTTQVLSFNTGGVQ